ncbi:MAG TPA: carboxypeptidase regulatory-like domain-containing protein [Gemmatimonadaceae bacterium]|nr:carboxypeptidase regulatory-like domain-containing protein [Gemmatimonadaceae bacterium]
MHVSWVGGRLRICLLLGGLTVGAVAPRDAHATTPAGGDIAGSIRDSTNGTPLPNAEIGVKQGGQIVANTSADQFGRFVVHGVPGGSYVVEVRLIGYKPDSQTVSVAEGARSTLSFQLISAPTQLQELTVTAVSPIAVDTRSGNQVYKQNDYHGAPSNTTSQILQQSIAGAARAPTGEVHIRGQHAEYQYYVDGVPVPSGISGSLNELFDPSVVDRIEFQTGGWDAEFGNKNAAIVDVRTRIPTGGFHMNLDGYGGSFKTDGAGLNISDNVGKWGFFLSGSRQETGMRQEPVMFDTTTLKPLNFHNSGQDYFSFGKLQFTPSDRDVFDVEGNWSRTHFLVPFDSTQGFVDDRQTDINSFANLGWRHRFGDLDSASASSGELFTGFYYRHGSLSYVPNTADEPGFFFFPDTITPYNINEQRNFNTYGTKIDFRWGASHALEVKTGVQASVTSGREDFNSTDASGNAGPGSNSDLKGHDIGVYVQDAYTPAEWIELRTGVRYDTHVAPFAGNQHQISPRVKLSFFPDLANTFYLYYGRQFIPTNIEDLRAITTVSEGGDTTSTSPTLPERDDFYEVGYVHRFPAGIVWKLDGYVKNSSPGIDDNTIAGTAIVTSVNLAQVRIRGIETVLEVRPGGPISGYLNFAINHAYGRGPVTGGFFPTDVADVPGGWFDLDHDQRISSVASVVYSKSRFFASATGIYGTGLANGADITSPIGTGLFDFNKSIHVDPSFIANGALGYSLLVGNTIVRPQLFVDNIFDKKYLLKGAFFSGASVGRPRTFEFRVDLGI